MVRLDPVSSSDVSAGRGLDADSTTSGSGGGGSPPGALSLITVQAGRAKIVLALLKVSRIYSLPGSNRNDSFWYSLVLFAGVVAGS